ncbi:hypothetical protein [Amycolatopsis sp. NPDC098790]|uniref:hypothetical protein n=1 Tax=Amycolatopsis sp. NPDC098790 TaxID=3363939 RepID=UPI00383037E2
MSSTSSSWPPLLLAAMTAALAWQRARPALMRIARCAAATCLAWWALRLLAGPATTTTAPTLALRWYAPGRALTVVLGPPHVQGTE